MLLQSTGSGCPGQEPEAGRSGAALPPSRECPRHSGPREDGCALSSETWEFFPQHCHLMSCVTQCKLLNLPEFPFPHLKLRVAASGGCEEGEALSKTHALDRDGMPAPFARHARRTPSRQRYS